MCPIEKMAQKKRERDRGGGGGVGGGIGLTLQRQRNAPPTPSTRSAAAAEEGGPEGPVANETVPRPMVLALACLGVPPAAFII
jgi:hypothetical protein